MMQDRRAGSTIQSADSGFWEALEETHEFERSVVIGGGSEACETLRQMAKRPQLLTLGGDQTSAPGQDGNNHAHAL
jgi:hypothetical protein